MRGTRESDKMRDNETNAIEKEETGESRARERQERKVYYFYTTIYVG